MATEHELKTWPEYWDAIRDGRKTFELRYNDRGYQTGDVLLLKRWSRKHSCYTEPYTPLRRLVTYIASAGRFGLKENWVCMSIQAIDEGKADAE